MLSDYKAIKLAQQHNAMHGTCGLPLRLRRFVEINTAFDPRDLNLAEAAQFLRKALGLKKAGNSIDWLATALLLQHKAASYPHAWDLATTTLHAARDCALNATPAGRLYLEQEPTWRPETTTRQRQRIAVAVAVAVANQTSASNRKC